MAGPRIVAARATSNDYTASQRLKLGLWLFDIWECAGFTSMYKDEERRYMSRLLVGSCVADLKQRPLTMTDAFIVMDARHGKTAAKYVAMAESQGLLKRVRDPQGDKRKTLLRPTDELWQKFNEEMARIGNDVRDLIEALADDYGLPETGAAAVVVKRRKGAYNRHISRAEANPSFPPRNLTGASFGP